MLEICLKILEGCLEEVKTKKKPLERNDQGGEIMNKYNIKIFGRNYILVTERDKKFAEKVENIINRDLKKIKAEFPNADFIDRLITYIFQLFEEKKAAGPE